MNILCMMRGENNLKVYYLALSLFLILLRTSDNVCNAFGRYRDKNAKKKILFYLWILGGIFWNIVYNDVRHRGWIIHLIME